MKCPNCGKEARDPILYCDYCETERAMVDLIDPAELCRLIEKADEIYEAIKSYLSGDPESLKKLAGE